MHPHVQQPARPSKWCTWYLRLPVWKSAAQAMTTMSQRERVQRAIEFRQPDRVPVVFWNCDQTKGDMLLYRLAL